MLLFVDVFLVCFVISKVVFLPFDFVCMSDPCELFLSDVGVGIPLDLFLSVTSC